MCLILMQIHSYIFNLAHRIRRKTNNLKTEELRKNMFIIQSVYTLRQYLSMTLNLLYTEELLFEGTD